MKFVVISAIKRFQGKKLVHTSVGIFYVSGAKVTNARSVGLTKDGLILSQVQVHSHLRGKLLSRSTHMLFYRDCEIYPTTSKLVL